MMFPTKLAALSTVVAVANALTINTPASLIECQPASITFSDGTAPYYLAILPGGQPSAAALENLPNAQSSPVTWTVDIAAGTNITIKLTDSTGTTQYSSAVVVQSGSSTSCLGTNSGSSASASSGASASAGSSASASAASGSAAAASGSAKASGSASGSSSAASASASAKSSAYLTRENAGPAAIVMGFVAAAMGIFA